MTAAQRKALLRDALDSLVEMNIFFGSMAGNCEPEAEDAIKTCRRVIAMGTALGALKESGESAGSLSDQEGKDAAE